MKKTSHRLKVSAKFNKTCLRVYTEFQTQYQQKEPNKKMGKRFEQKLH